jgi:hypothetical protein
VSPLADRPVQFVGWTPGARLESAHVGLCPSLAWSRDLDHIRHHPPSAKPARSHAGSTTRIGSADGSSLNRTATTRSAFLGGPSGITSPARQLGTALAKVGGLAGVRRVHELEVECHPAPPVSTGAGRRGESSSIWAWRRRHEWQKSISAYARTAAWTCSLWPFAARTTTCDPSREAITLVL